MRTGTPRKHVFICVNERDGKCCASVKGMELFLSLKRWVIANGLAQSIWVTKTGCLGFCNNVGATVVIYPEGTWLLQTVDVEQVKEKILDGL